MNGILALKLNIDDCYINVLLDLCSKDDLIVSHLLLGSLIPVVGFYGILVMPTVLGLLHLAE